MSARWVCIGQTTMPGAKSGVAGRANLRMSRRWASIQETAWAGSRTRLAGARTSVSARWTWIGNPTSTGHPNTIPRAPLPTLLYTHPSNNPPVSPLPATGRS